MVNCSYCNKELDRQVFCKPSHKVMYHKKGGAKVVKSSPEVVNKVVNPNEDNPKWCEEHKRYKWVCVNWEHK